MLVHSSVRPSPIEGLGLFAEQEIPAGTLVWEFDPRFDVIIDERDLEIAAPPVRAHFDRFGYKRTDLPGFLVLDSDDGRYINHADDPNLDSRVPGRGFARRDISVGEEITCCYDELEPGPWMMVPPREHFSRHCPGPGAAAEAGAGMPERALAAATAGPGDIGQ